MRTPLLCLALLAACAATPRRAEPRPVEIWIADETSDEDRTEIARVLKDHPPPRHEKLPPHRSLRRVHLAYDDSVSWELYIDLAMSHARMLDADGVVLLSHTIPPAWGDWRGSPGVVDIDVVRYE